MTDSSMFRRRLAPAILAAGLTLLAAGPLRAADAAAPPADRARQQAAFQAYTDAWATAPASERLKHLQDSLAAGMTYQDASVRAEGVSGVDTMIAKFQHQSPGVTLRLDDLLLWSNHGLARWSMSDPKGGVIMHGYDAVTYDAAGRILTIVGFFDIPSQRQPAPH